MVVIKSNRFGTISYPAELNALHMDDNTDRRSVGEEEKEEAEDCISTEAVTSTPASGKGKRKREETTGSCRNTRRRSSRLRAMSKNGTESSGMDDSREEMTPSLTAMITQMSRDIAKLTKNVTGIEDKIVNTVAASIAPLTKKIDATEKKVNRMEKKQTAELAAIRETVGDQVRLAVEEKIEEIGKKVSGCVVVGGEEDEEENENTYAKKTADGRRGKESGKKSGQGNAEDQAYWNARRCLRVYPVPGKDEQEQIRELDAFVLDKLKIPSGVLNQKDINYIRRVRTTRNSKIKDELLVSFSSIEARDLVLSYARNLSEWVDGKGAPTAGLRLEIPEKLMGDFKSLEQYGHAMRGKHGNGLKRHIKMDDSIKGLYIDLYLPKQKEWVRVDLDIANRDNKSRRTQKSKKIPTSQLFTSESAEENDE